MSYTKFTEMKLPKKIKVGGHWIDVKTRPSLDNGNTSGYYLYRTNLILLADKVIEDPDSKKLLTPSVQSKQITFLHELIHAIDFIYNSNSLSEKEIDRLSEGIYQVLKDNPDVFKFLIYKGDKWKNTK